MTGDLQTLWALQGLDERVVAAQAKLARHPGDRKSLETMLAGERTRLEQFRKQIGELQLRHRQLEKDIEALLAEERKFQSQLPLVKKNEEYSALLHEITGRKAARSDRETDLLVMLEEEQRLEAEKPRIEQALRTAESDAATRLQAIAAEEAKEREEVAALEAERQQWLQKLAGPLRSRYEKIRTGHQGRAVVAILKGACGGCYRNQPPQVLQEARRGDRVLICEGCGRLLIWPPEGS